MIIDEFLFLKYKKKNVLFNNNIWNVINVY